MDESVNAARLLAALLLAAVPQVHAQSADPTRPPAPLLAPGQAAAEPGGPVLQSISVSYGTPPRKVAIISGVAVQVGDRVGTAVVQSMDEREVVLRTAHGERRVLKLYGAAGASAPDQAAVKDKKP